MHNAGQRGKCLIRRSVFRKTIKLIVNL